MWHFTAFSPSSLYLWSKDEALFCVFPCFPLPLVEGCGTLLRFPRLPSTSGRGMWHLERVAGAEQPAGRAEKPPKLFRRDQPPRCVLRGGGAFPPPPFPHAPPSFISFSLFLDSLIHTFLTFNPSFSPSSSPVLLTLPSPLYLRCSSDL